MNKVDLVEQSRLRNDIPSFRPGDQVRVHVKVREGGRERVQIFEGVVIARRGGGLRESFTVRKVSFGVGVERTFPLHAPVIAKIEIARHGRVRRAKLYYLRALSGRHAKIAERRTRIPSDGAPTPIEEVELEADVAPVEDETAEAVEIAGEAEAAAPEAEAPAEPEEAPAEPAAEPVAADEPKAEGETPGGETARSES